MGEIFPIGPDKSASVYKSSALGRIEKIRRQRKFVDRIPIPHAGPPRPRSDLEVRNARFGESLMVALEPWVEIRQPK
jgi:hypothetical protein